MLENDDCFGIIRDHLDRDLGLNPDVYMQRAHRLGSIKVSGEIEMVAI